VYEGGTRGIRQQADTSGRYASGSTFVRYGRHQDGAALTAACPSKGPSAGRDLAQRCRNQSFTAPSTHSGKQTTFTHIQ